MRPCTVEGCSDPRRSSGALYCEMHYGRVRRGKPLEGPKQVRKYTKCSVDGCGKKPSGKYCSMHAARIRRHGDPDTCIPQRDRNFPRGEANHNWKGEDISYHTAHDRLRRWRGPASECVRCSSSGPYQWAYDRENAKKRLVEDGMPYSPDVNDYMPLCVSCHKFFDLSMIEG